MHTQGVNDMVDYGYQIVKGFTVVRGVGALTTKSSSSEEESEPYVSRSRFMLGGAKL